jgi:protein-S-isoprenylcysteine O-methyltransferase Ste14
MTVAGAVQLGVIAILFVTIALKIRGQTRQGVRAVVLGKAGGGLLARLEPLEVVLLFLWFGAIALHGAGLAPGLFEPRLFRSAGAETAGTLLALGALGLLIAAVRQMGLSWRIGIDPEVKQPLVTSGVFGVSRNPIYVAMDLLAVAVFLTSGSVFFLGSGLLVAAGIHVQILREERFLAGRFGDEYAAYCARVRRYLGRHGSGPAR